MLHSVLLYQPATFTSSARIGTLNDDIIPLFETTYITPPPIDQIDASALDRTPESTATMVKGMWYLTTENPKQFRFFT